MDIKFYIILIMIYDYLYYNNIYPKPLTLSNKTFLKLSIIIFSRENIHL